MIEVAHMPKTRRTVWYEPYREGPPTLDVVEVMKKLDYKNPQSVHSLANRGPENGGLQAYIERKGSDGLYRWVRKPADPKQSYPGQRERFYEEDVAEWDRNNLRKPALKLTPYTENERRFVLPIAREMQDPRTGVVQRTKLMDRLAELQGKRIWNARSYNKLKHILDDAGIPGGIQHDPSPRRQRPPRASNGY